MRTLLFSRDNEDRLRGLDGVAAVITLLLGCGELLRLCISDDPNEPFAAYDADAGIRLIWFLAVTADFTLVGAVVAWAVRPAWAARAQLMIVLAAAIAALLPWGELWWGNNPAYSGVRDKMGLPWSVVHFGPAGTFLFASYLILRVKIPAPHALARPLVRLALIIALWYLQPTLLRALEGPWALYQS